MLAYSILYYLDGGSIFYVFFEIFVCFASRLKMLKKPSQIDMRILGGVWGAFFIATLSIDQSISTLRFIAWFLTITLGYICKAGTARRNMALTIGSILIVIFSIYEQNRIFIGINVLFSLFSWFYRAKFYVEEKDEKLFVIDRNVGLDKKIRIDFLEKLNK